jgi:hypothetical protein
MSNTSVPGMNYPTQKAMLSGNPRDSAIQQGINSNTKLASMGKIGGKKKGGADANTSQTIPTPQYQMLYTPQGGDNSTPNAQIQQNALISTQGAANSVYDKQAMTGGNKKLRYKKGGYSNFKWGCYSGGKGKSKKSKKTKKSKSKKYRRNKKTRKH